MWRYSLHFSHFHVFTKFISCHFTVEWSRNIWFLGGGGGKSFVIHLGRNKGFSQSSLAQCITKKFCNLDRIWSPMFWWCIQTNMLCLVPTVICVSHRWVIARMDSLIAFWIEFTHDCNGYVMSTRDDVSYDGIQISCHSSGLDFALMVGSSSATLPTTETCCTWIHVVLVGKLPYSVGVAYNGNLGHTAALTNGNTSYAQSTSREIVFGNQWINDEGAEFGTACIDHVVIYNTMLLPTAVENLFNSYNWGKLVQPLTNINVNQVTIINFCVLSQLS